MSPFKAQLGNFDRISAEVQQRSSRLKDTIEQRTAGIKKAVEQRRNEITEAVEQRMAPVRRRVAGIQLAEQQIKDRARELNQKIDAARDHFRKERTKRSP